MGDRLKLFKHLCGVVASFAFLSVAVKSELAISPEAQTSENIDRDDLGESDHNSCKNLPKTSNERFLMLVSTLDGKISALNVEKEGALEWSISTGTGPLLSSSISNLEINRDGHRIRLIPSLDGGLYQYDGVSVEPVPFNAETLLSSSFRLNDNSIMVGGKESETYGVDLTTGRVKYVCDMEGCKQIETEENVDAVTSETLVISRTTRTVRAADMVSGLEKWNFSVGEHELLYVTAAKADIHDATSEITDQSSEAAGEEEDIRVETCDETDYVENENLFDFPWWNEAHNSDTSDVHVQVIVPKGLIVAVSKSQPSRVLWQHQFEHAIAKAWMLRAGELETVDLFDASNVPALAYDEKQVQEESDAEALYLPDAPALYIGSHQHQLYVQASVRMMQAVEQSVTHAVATHSPINMPTVTWRPYIASSPSRTPAEQRNPLQITNEDGRLRDQEREERDSTAVSLWCEYPHDVGFYLFPDTTPLALPYENQSHSAEEGGEDFYFNQNITLTLWNWWREVAAISIASAILLNIAYKIFKIYFLKPCLDTVRSPGHSRQNSESEKSAENKETDNASTNSGSAGVQAQLVEKPIPFASRYESDFELVERIGQGGFGQVFHVKNRIDDVDYAIKRITLNNSEKSKERVSREVKALAKLAHPGIVRYHQAWIECPPAGWQEQRDRQRFPGEESHSTLTATELSPSLDHERFSTTPGLSIYHEANKKKSSEKDPTFPSNEKKKKSEDFNPLKPFDIHDFSPHNTNEDNTSHSFGSFDGGIKTENVHGKCTRDSRKNGSTEPFDPLSSGSWDTSFSAISRDIIRHSEESESTFDNKSESESAYGNSPKTVSGAFLSPDITTDDESSIVFANDVSETQESDSIPFNRYRNSPEADEDSLDIVFEKSQNESDGEFTNESSSLSEQNCSNSCNVSEIKSRNSCHKKKKNSKTKCDKHEPSEYHNHDSCDNQSKSHDLETDISHKNEHRTRTNTLELVKCDKGMACDNVHSQHGEKQGVQNVDQQEDKSEPKQAESSRERIYLYIQMELCEKHSLKDWLARPDLRDDDRALDIFWQIVSAVDYVHQCGLMHRDLKPSNILFSLDGAVKVGDFGLVTAVEHERVAHSLLPAHAQHHVRAEHTDQVGTRLYMSPEQMKSKRYSHMVDIYALGLILFELFTEPFGTQFERIRTILSVRKLNFPRTFIKDRPIQYELAHSMLSPKPEDRPSANQILEHTLLAEHDQQQNTHARARSASRTRTVSTCSNHSGQSNLSTSVPRENAV